MEKRRKVVEEAQEVDRISELPDSLCHQILRHLPATDARITCLLSRRWRLISYTCPFYDFDEHTFRSSVFNRMRFSEFVLDTLERHERYSGNPKIEFLRLSMLPFPDHELHVLERSLILSRRMDVKELHLICGGILPSQFLISQSITILNLSYYTIECSYPINLPSLKTLDLEMVDLPDGGLEKLLSNCPSIENLRLVSLRSIISVNISSHTLKSLFLRLPFMNQKVRIEAPNLETLYFMCGYLDIQLDIASCTRLRSLTIFALDSLSDDVLEDLILQNPHLEKLNLRNCFGLNQTRIRSKSLAHLNVFNCRNMVELSIDAPHLRRFTHEGNLMSLSKLNSTQLFESEISFHNLESYEQWHNKLKHLLEKFEQCRVLTLNSLEDKQLVVPGELRESLPFKLYGVKNLKVKIEKSTMNYSELLDGLRWSFPSLKTLEIEISKPVGVCNKYWQTAGDVGAETIWRYMGFT